MQYLLYCVVCFRVWITTREVFMVDVVDVALANHGVFMWWHTHDAKVASTWYKRANGIQSPSNSDIDNPYFTTILIKVLFWSLGFRAAIYLWSNHYDMFPNLGWGCFGLGHFLHIFVTRHHFFCWRHFFFILHHLLLIVRNTSSHIIICVFDEIIKKLILILHSTKNPFLAPKIRSSNLKEKQYPHEGIP